MNTTILSQPNTTSIPSWLPPMASPHSNNHNIAPIEPNFISHEEFGSHLRIPTAYYAWSRRCRSAIRSFLNYHQHNLGLSNHLFLPHLGSTMLFHLLHLMDLRFVPINMHYSPKSCTEKHKCPIANQTQWSLSSGYREEYSCNLNQLDDPNHLPSHPFSK